MSRAVIPPLPPMNSSPSQQTVQVLEKRIQSAEEDASLLLQQMSGRAMGFSPRGDIKEQFVDSGNEISDVKLLRTNYEGLVSRLCRAESAIQTVKSNLSGNRNTLLKQNQENMNRLKHLYEEETVKLKCEIESLKKELSQETEDKYKVVDERRQLQISVQSLSNMKDETMTANEDLANSNQKLQRKLTELRDELQRECSLRESLEESHNVLLARVRDIESTVDEERSEVETLTSDCLSHKTEIGKLHGELKQEQQKRMVAERTYIQTVEDNENLKKCFEQVDADRKLLTSELERIQTQYRDLIKQLEQTQIVVDQQKAEKTRLSEKLALEEELVKLKNRLRELSEDNDALDTKVHNQKQDMAELQRKYQQKDDESKRTTNNMKKELNLLQQQINSFKQEREKAAKDKDNLLEEVNQTVDSLVSERTQHQTELSQLRMELDNHLQVKGQLEAELSNQQQMVKQLHQQQENQKRVEASLKEMMEQKNKYAYDNGHLQATVAQLQSQIHASVITQTEAVHLRELNTSLQEKYNKALKEICELKSCVQKYQKQAQHSQNEEEIARESINSLEKTNGNLKAENQQLQSEIKTTEEKSKQKIFALQKNLDDTKVVNKEIASTLESVMASHSQLQKVVEEIQLQLGKKDAQISHLKNEKKRETENLNEKLKSSQMRIDTLQEERDRSQKKTSREVKKHNDNLFTRNIEMVKTNTELRQTVSKQEQTIQDLKHKLAENKRKMDYLQLSKKSLDVKVLKSENVKADLEELERIKEMYMKKNQEQSERICGFMAQICSLQGEIQFLAQAQAATNELIQQKDNALHRERTIREELLQRYKMSKIQAEETALSKMDAENRLKDAQNESVEISLNLQDAHDWFKSKFENLQEELISSKKLQERLEEENSGHKSRLKEERTASQMAAEKAKEMIVASRKTISRLSDYTKIADQETKQQLTELQEELLKEKAHSKYLELKHNQYKNAANCQLETLLNGT